MKRVIVGITIMLLAPSLSAAAVTTDKGARATLTTDTAVATIFVSEKGTVGEEETQRSGSLDITIGDEHESLTCTYTMSDDPVINGAAQLNANCAPYEVVANFVINGGGTFNIALVCSTDASRPSNTSVTITRAGVLVASGTTTNSRVWTNVDYGTCESENS